jgi:hypothetical protein
MYFLNQTSFEVSKKQGPGFDVMFDNAESLSKLLTLSQVSQLGIKVFGKPFKSGTGKNAACQSIVEHIDKGGAQEKKPGATEGPDKFTGSNRASMSKAGERTKDIKTAQKVSKKVNELVEKMLSKKDAGKAPKKPVKTSKKSRSTRSGKKEKDAQTSKKGTGKQTSKKPDKAQGKKDVKTPKKGKKQAPKTQEPGKRGRKTPIYTLTTGKDLPYRFKTLENKREILVNNHAWALLEGIEALIQVNGEGCQATAEKIVEEARETRLFRIHGTNETAKRLMTRWHKCLKAYGWLNP